MGAESVEVAPVEAESPSTGSASTPTGRAPGPRAAYPGSAPSSANFSLNGQTS